MGHVSVEHSRNRTSTPRDPILEPHKFPHLDLIGDCEAELERIRVHYNKIRLHAGIGYVNPDDEHHGRGQAIRHARVKGM